MLRIRALHTERFSEVMSKAFGLDVRPLIPNSTLTPIMAQAIGENVALIKTIPERHLTTLSAQVARVQTERPFDQRALREVFSSSYNVTGYNLRRLTRDQTSKVMSRFNEERQKQVGIREYVWKTSQDERVRDSHAAKEGRTFSWEDPPPDTGHPGNDIQCRCVANAVIPVRARSVRPVSRTRTPRAAEPTQPSTGVAPAPLHSPTRVRTREMSKDEFLSGATVNDGERLTYVFQSKYTKAEQAVMREALEEALDALPEAVGHAIARNKTYIRFANEKGRVGYYQHGGGRYGRHVLVTDKSWQIPYYLRDRAKRFVVNQGTSWERAVVSPTEITGLDKLQHLKVKTKDTLIHELAHAFDFTLGQNGARTLWWNTKRLKLNQLADEVRDEWTLRVNKALDIGEKYKPYPGMDGLKAPDEFVFSDYEGFVQHRLSGGVSAEYISVNAENYFSMRHQALLNPDDALMQKKWQALNKAMEEGSPAMLNMLRYITDLGADDVLL